MTNSTSFLPSRKLFEALVSPRVAVRSRILLMSIVSSSLTALVLLSLLAWHSKSVAAAGGINAAPSSSLHKMSGFDEYVSKTTSTNSLPEFSTIEAITVGDSIVTTTASFSIDNNSDDAGIYAASGNCENKLNANEVYVGWCDKGTSPITSGLRFVNVSVPDEATLIDAFLRVAVEPFSRDIPETRIYGEAVASSPTFTSSDFPSDRMVYTTSHYALWDTATQWVGGVFDNTFYDSPSVLTVMNDIMETSGWASGNPVTFLLVPDSNVTVGGRSVYTMTDVHHRFRARDYNTSTAARLFLTYTETRRANPAASMLTAQPVSATADGSDFITVTVTVSDSYGPLRDKTVTLSATGPISVSWLGGNQTDANGQVFAHITSTTSQTTTLSAFVVEDDISLDQEVEVIFTDVPISGLVVVNDSPTEVGEATTFTATTTAGTNVLYQWAFGDGSNQSNGPLVTHSYAFGGNYTATITASNDVSAMTATTTVQIYGSTDLQIGKTGPSEINAGSLLVYEITVANVGTSPATAIELTDTLPLSVTFSSQSSPYTYTYDAETRTVTWQIGFLPEGASETFILQAQVGLNAPDTIINNLTGTLAEPDPDLTDNQASHSATVLPPILGPDVAVYKSSPSKVPAGFPVEWNIVVSNQGGQPATNIVVTDTLPISTTLSSSSHPAYNTTYDPATRTVVWNIGSLAAYSSYNIQLQAELEPDAPTGIMINQVAATAKEDTTGPNNQASAFTEVVPPQPVLTINPTTSGSQSGAALLAVPEGGSTTTVFTVTNTGTGPLTGGFALSYGDGAPQINYPWLAITPTVTVDDLAIGQSVPFTVSVTDALIEPGNYYDVIGIDSPHDSRVSSVPYYLRVYIHPQLVDFTVPVTNTMGDAVPEARVSFEKVQGSAWVVDGEALPDANLTVVGTANEQALRRCHK